MSTYGYYLVSIVTLGYEIDVYRIEIGYVNVNYYRPDKYEGFA